MQIHVALVFAPARIQEKIVLANYLCIGFVPGGIRFFSLSLLAAATTAGRLVWAMLWTSRSFRACQGPGRLFPCPAKGERIGVGQSCTKPIRDLRHPQPATGGFGPFRPEASCSGLGMSQSETQFSVVLDFSRILLLHDLNTIPRGPRDRKNEFSLGRLKKPFPHARKNYYR